MDQNTLIATVSEIVDNANIEKKGLSLTYVLDSFQHRNMQEYFHLAQNRPIDEMIYNKVFEVEIGGLVVKFVEK